MLHNSKSKYIFIHIPRTGGTSIRSMMTNSEGLRWPTLGYCIPASVMREKLGAGEFGACFKFTVVRNPWDRMVSYYHFLKDDPIGSKYQYPGGLGAGETFIEWVIRRFTPPNQNFPNGDYYSGKWLGDGKGNLLVDEVLRFENLTAGLQPILNRFGIHGQLPHVNKSSRQPYYKYYDDASREIVRRNFAKDIELFGYEF